MQGLLGLRARLSLTATLVLGATALVVARSAPESVELAGHDLIVATLQAPPASPEIAVVDYDDGTAERYGAAIRPQLPRLLRAVQAAGADLVGLDVLLDEARDPGQDDALEAALAATDNVVLAAVFGNACLPAAEPLPRFARHALDVAYVNLPTDVDGTIRRFLLYRPGPGGSGTRLGLPAALASNRRRAPLVREGSSYQLASRSLPGAQTDPTSVMIGPWARPARVSAADLLDGSRSLPSLAGRIVLIGHGAAAGKDLFVTPLFRAQRDGQCAELVPGVFLHAAALETLLDGTAVGPLGLVPHVALALGLGGAGLLAMLRLRPGIGLTLVLLGALGIPLGARAALARGVWPRWVALESQLALGAGAGLAIRMLDERRRRAELERERSHLMGLFGRYVSPEIADEIWRRRREVVLKGEQRFVTVLFSDIRGFTALSAGKPSAEVLGWLNRYFDEMAEAVAAHGGLLNKFIGDGLMVVFGVPLSTGIERDALRALATAREMQARVARLNAAGGAAPRLAIGIGVHSGEVTAGGVGSRDRLEYSIIGETVNLASRLESLTKEVGASILLSRSTRDLVGDGGGPLRAVGAVAVRGFSQPVEVYAPEDVPPSEVLKCE
ncbi:MAG: CHASE2 domain-containing protein [Vicinamibacteria bacterium]